MCWTRARIPFHQVTGVLDEAATWQEIEEWLAAARVRAALASSRLGLMGHYYSGMLDIMTDVTLVSIAFGTHVEIVEVDELSALCGRCEGRRGFRARGASFQRSFDVQPDCAAEELRRAARTSVALDAFVAQHELDAMAYYYKGSGNAANEDTMSSIILGTSLLTARHIPVAGEYEVKNVLAMKMMDVLGAGGSFTEYYAMDFNDDLVLMGHDGPGHIAIAEGKTKVRPLKVYHGKVGRGLSVEMSVKHGPVTLLSVAEDAQSRFKLVVAEGECVAGAILEIGNTNSRYRFPLGARGFVDAWNAQAPAHHCAVGVGHVAATLEKDRGADGNRISSRLLTRRFRIGLQVREVEQKAGQRAAHQGARDRNGRVTPVRTAFARNGQDGMDEPGPQVARGIDSVAGGAAKGQADAPDQAAHKPWSQSAGRPGCGNSM